MLYLHNFWKLRTLPLPIVSHNRTAGQPDEGRAKESIPICVPFERTFPYFLMWFNVVGHHRVNLWDHKLTGNYVRISEGWEFGKISRDIASQETR